MQSKMLEMSPLGTEGACGQISNSPSKLQQENRNPVGGNLPAVIDRWQTDRHRLRHRDTERDTKKKTQRPKH